MNRYLPVVGRLAIVGAILVALYMFMLVIVPNTPQRKPGVYEMPSNELTLHYDYSRDVACYSYGMSMSCVHIPQTDGGK